VKVERSTHRRLHVRGKLAALTLVTWPPELVLTLRGIGGAGGVCLDLAFTRLGVWRTLCDHPRWEHEIRWGLWLKRRPSIHTLWFVRPKPEQQRLEESGLSAMEALDEVRRRERQAWDEAEERRQCPVDVGEAVRLRDALLEHGWGELVRLVWINADQGRASADRNMLEIFRAGKLPRREEGLPTP
jgi:hypothetical protein